MNKPVSQVSGAFRAETRGEVFWQLMLWAARLGSIGAIVPLLMILVGEPGTGPADVREWIYLAFFPIGFVFGYLIAWRWPVAGGVMSLACMAASLAVIGRTFPASAYLIWAALGGPAGLFVGAGVRRGGGVSCWGLGVGGEGGGGVSGWGGDLG